MRGRHFDYIYENEAADFFTKVAVKNSGVNATMPAPAAMTKTAGPKPTAFEKLASRLERDLDMLKVAGAIGINAGMMKRGDAYITTLLSNVDLTPVQFGEVFDKVASFAIQTDIEAAYEQLCEDLPPHLYSLVDDVLIKIGKDVTAAALAEKAALVEKLALSLGALNRIGHVAEEAGALRSASKGVEGLEGVSRAGLRTSSEAPNLSAGIRAAGGAAKEVAGGVGKAAKNVATTVGEHGYNALAGLGNAVVGKPLAAAGKAIDKIRDWKTSRMMSAPERLQGAIDSSHASGAVASGVKKSLGNQLNEAEAKRTAHLARTSENPMHSATANPAGAADAKATKSEIDRQQGQAGAAAATKVPKAAPIEKAPKTEAPEKPATGGSAEHAEAPPAVKANPKLGDTWKKATTGGWKSLSDEEKGSLIRAGVTAAVVGRAVTGHGIITGGEGLI